MSLKIFSRTLFVKNLIIFVMLSYFFVYFLENFNHPLFFTDLELFKAFSIQNIPFLGITLFLIFTISLVLRWSRFFFLIYSMGIFLYALRIYFTNDSSVVLPLSLIYMMVSYYFYILFSEELLGAIYRPQYEIADINPVKNRKLRLKIKYKGGEVDGHIINWDEGNVFFYTGNDLKLRGVVGLNLMLDGVNFSFEGKIVTAYNKGYGVRIIDNSSSESFNWNELYKILSDRGYGHLAKDL